MHPTWNLSASSNTLTASKALTVHKSFMPSPLEGVRHIKVTSHRAKTDYAHFLADLSDQYYADADKIVLVQDNLNTHSQASLYATFPPAEARRLAKRFEWHFRFGQKNKITRRWAKRGTRPSAPKDQRTRSAWIFGAICPARGVGVALVLPICNTIGMNLHLKEISLVVAPGAHAIVIVDQAGWHFSNGLEKPDNITLVPLPPRSPELNPVGNIWQFMRDNWLSNRVFKSYNDIVDHSCFAWNQLIDQP